MHRKELIRYFGAGVQHILEGKSVKKRGRKTSYGYLEFKETFGKLWLEANKVCARSLKAGMHEMASLVLKVS